MRGDIMAGTPYVRIDNTTRHVSYDNLEVVQSEESITFIATGLYSDDSGARARFIGRTLIARDA